MTSKYPFPGDIRDPNRKESNPFADDDPSLVRDDAIEGYSPSEHSNEYQPVYQAILLDRAMLCIVCGIIGLITSLPGWLSLDITPFFSLLWIMPLLSLAGSLPAVLFSIADLRAMRRGAMKTNRRGLSALACFIGAIGLINTILFYCYWAFKTWV